MRASQASHVTKNGISKIERTEIQQGFLKVQIDYLHEVLKMNKDKKFLVIQEVRNKSDSFTFPNMELLGMKQCTAKQKSDAENSMRQLSENYLVRLICAHLNFNNSKSGKDS
jgi:hypothetical protein